MGSIRSCISGVMRKLHRFLSVETVLVLGDSHVEVFSNRKFLQAFPKIYFDVCSVGGATASGLENPRSKTQAFQIFGKALNERKYDRIIAMLGEVDTGFVIWYRAQKYNVSVEEMFDLAVANYSAFLRTLQRYGDVLVVSTPLPTIDDASKGDVVNARKEVKTTQKERTDLTLRFNRSTEEFCQQNGIKYLNLDAQSLDARGIVRKELKNKDPRDHHYDFKEYAKIIIAEFEKLEIHER